MGDITFGWRAASERVERRLDGISHRLFGHHASSPRHDNDRAVYRGTNIDVDFETYVARTYTASWGGAVASGVLGGVMAGVLGAVLAGALAKWLVIILRRRYLRWKAAARQAEIERTLPAAIQHLRILAISGGPLRSMLRQVAEANTHGETAVAFRTVLHRTDLSGSLNRGLRSVARDTPSNMLAPLLLKLREYATTGPEELAAYLQMESRMLDHQQASLRARREGILGVLTELFVVLLAAPALVVVVVAVAAVFSTGLDQGVVTPLGDLSLRTLLLEAGAVGVVVVGWVSVKLIESLRPPATAGSLSYPESTEAALQSVGSNPASTAVVLTPVGLAVAGSGLLVGGQPVTSGVAGYAVWAIPVGSVAIRRTRRMAVRNREFRDVIHALARHMTLGRTLAEAVERVATNHTPQAIGEDLRSLHFRTQLRTTPTDATARTATLKRFADDIGTPLAERIIEVFIGGLNAGSDTETIVEVLETEVDRSHHARRTQRQAMRAYVVIGWTTALLVITIAVAVSVHVLPALAQLAVVADHGPSMVIRPQSGEIELLTTQFYHIAVASALACGWFAGTAGGDRYEGLFHSGLLVLVAYISFWGVGLA